MKITALYTRTWTSHCFSPKPDILIRSVAVRSDPSKFKIQETFAAGKREDMFKSKKEAHEKADNTSVKTLVIPSCVFGALSPPFLVLPLYPPPPQLPLLRVKIKAGGIKGGRAVHL